MRKFIYRLFHLKQVTYGGNGGDISFRTGCGARKNFYTDIAGDDGEFYFFIGKDENPVMKITKEGFFSNGELKLDQGEIYKLAYDFFAIKDPNGL